MSVRKSVMESDSLPHGEERDRVLTSETPGGGDWTAEPGSTQKLDGKVKVALPQGTFRIDEEIASGHPASANPGKGDIKTGEEDRKNFAAPMSGCDADKLLQGKDA